MFKRAYELRHGDKVKRNARTVSMVRSATLTEPGKRDQAHKAIVIRWANGDVSRYPFTARLEVL